MNKETKDGTRTVFESQGSVRLPTNAKPNQAMVDQLREVAQKNEEASLSGNGRSASNTSVRPESESQERV